MGEQNHHKEETLQVWETGKSPQKECAHCRMIAHLPGGISNSLPQGAEALEVNSEITAITSFCTDVTTSNQVSPGKIKTTLNERN